MIPSSPLDHWIAHLQDIVPKHKRIVSAFDLKVRKSPLWQSQSRWARMGRATLLIAGFVSAMHLLGWRIVNRESSDLADVARMAVPDSPGWLAAEARAKIANRAQAVFVVEKLLAAPPEDLSWLSRIFTSSGPRIDLDKSAALDNLVRQLVQNKEFKSVDQAQVVNRMLVFAQHLDDNAVMNMIVAITSMPENMRRELSAQNGKILSDYVEIARALSVSKSENREVVRSLVQERDALKQKTAEASAERAELDRSLKQVLAEFDATQRKRTAINSCILKFQRER